MKKILILITIAISIISCNETYTVQETVPQVADGYISNVIRFGYDGHDYIMFRTHGKHNTNSVGGVIHDPDCHCFDKK